MNHHVRSPSTRPLVRSLQYPSTTCPLSYTHPPVHPSDCLHGVRTAHTKHRPLLDALYKVRPILASLIHLLAVCIGAQVSVVPLKRATLHVALRNLGSWSELRRNPCNFFPRRGQLQSMEKGSIYVDKDHVTGTRGESLGSITGRRSGGRQVAKSEGIMQELTLLGRNRGAHSEEISRTREFQVMRSVVGGQRGRRMLRGGSSGSSLPVAAVGSWGSIPPSVMDSSQCQGTKCTKESRGEVLDSTTFGSVTKRCCSQNKLRRTNRGPLKLMIIADNEFLCGLKIIVGSIWRAST